MAPLLPLINIFVLSGHVYLYICVLYNVGLCMCVCVCVEGHGIWAKHCEVPSSCETQTIKTTERLAEQGDQYASPFLPSHLIPRISFPHPRSLSNLLFPSPVCSIIYNVPLLPLDLIFLCYMLLIMCNNHVLCKKKKRCTTDSGMNDKEISPLIDSTKWYLCISTV